MSYETQSKHSERYMWWRITICQLLWSYTKDRKKAQLQNLQAPRHFTSKESHLKKKKPYTTQASPSDSHLPEKHIEKKVGCLGQRLDKREKEIKRFLLIHQRFLGEGIYEESPGSEAQHGNTPWDTYLSSSSCHSPLSVFQICEIKLGEMLCLWRPVSISFLWMGSHVHAEISHCPHMHTVISKLENLNNSGIQLPHNTLCRSHIVF